jgi:Immunity protein Imm1
MPRLPAQPVLYWSENEPPAEVDDLSQLDACLNRIAANCKPDRPTIVDLVVHNHSVSFGLGLPETFIQVQSQSGMPPYFITVADRSAPDVVTYYLMGAHHTEIPRRHHIDSTLAREIVREFFTTGERSTKVDWEEV